MGWACGAQWPRSEKACGGLWPRKSRNGRGRRDVRTEVLDDNRTQLDDETQWRIETLGETLDDGRGRRNVRIDVLDDDGAQSDDGTQ